MPKPAHLEQPRIRSRQQLCLACVCLADARRAHERKAGIGSSAHLALERPTLGRAARLLVQEIEMAAAERQLPNIHKLIAQHLSLHSSMSSVSGRRWAALACLLVEGFGSWLLKVGLNKPGSRRGTPWYHRS